MRSVTLSFVMYRAIPTFQLTRSMRSVTIVWLQTVREKKISTHTLHAERDEYISQKQLVEDWKISTHTLHAERDCVGKLFLPQIMISTHTLHAERDFLFIMFCSFQQ